MESVGELLRSEREAQEKTLDDVASATRMSVRILESIEAGRRLAGALPGVGELRRRAELRNLAAERGSGIGVQAGLSPTTNSFSGSGRNASPSDCIAGSIDAAVACMSAKVAASQPRHATAARGRSYSHLTANGL